MASDFDFICVDPSSSQGKVRTRIFIRANAGRYVWQQRRQAAQNLISNTLRGNNPDTIRADASDQIAEHHVPIYPSVKSANFKFQALGFFHTSYVWLNAASILSSDPDQDLSPDAPLGKKALRTSTTLVGMANLSSVQNSKSMQVAARREYANALERINKALSDRVQAKEDTTLMAIICLSLYELIKTTEPETKLAWVKHVRGAMTLLEIRGEGQLKRPIGLELFYTLRNEILVGCVYRRILVPSTLVELSERAASLPGAPPATVVGVRLIKAVAQLCGIRIDAHSRPKEHDPQLLSRALMLDSEFASLLLDLSKYTPASSDTRWPLQVSQHYHLNPFTGAIHIYESQWLSNVWNNYRYSRILLNQIIIDQLRLMADQPESTATMREIGDQYRQVRELMRQLASDICASVPFQFGLVSANPDDISDPPRINSSMGGFTLLFPLYVAGCVDGGRSPLADWVVGSFTIIARELGIHQALALSQLLRQEPAMVHWAHDTEDWEPTGRPVIA